MTIEGLGCMYCGDIRKRTIQEMNKRIDEMIVYYNKSDSAKYILNELKKSLKEEFKGDKE